VQTATAAETTAAIKERDEFKAKVVVLETEIASRTLETSGLVTQTDNLRKRLRQLLAEKQDATNTEKTLRDSVSSLEAQLATLKNRAQVDEPKIEKAVTPAAPVPSTKNLPVSTDSAKPTLPKPLSKPSPAPSVPAEGFKFGPSQRQESKQLTTSSPTKPATAAAAPKAPFQLVAEAKAEAVSKVIASSTSVSATSLRPSAPAFVPTQPTQQSSTESTKELQEKLAEKKRKLHEALARKAAAAGKTVTQANKTPPSGTTSESKADDADTTEAKLEVSPVKEPVQKRRKTSKDENDAVELEAETMAADPVANEEPEKKQEKSVETKAGAKPDETEPANPDSIPDAETREDQETETAEAKESQPVLTSQVKQDDAIPDDLPEPVDIGALEDEGTGDADNDETDEAIGMLAEGDDEDEDDDGAVIEVEPDTDEPRTATPFGMQATMTPFGGFGSGTAVPILGQGSGFGSTMTGGGAFLDIKPPGSSSAAPTFSFGSSPSITLPMPSQTLSAPSPFGVFGGGTASTGSAFTFGQSSTSFAAAPLFGSPTATTADVMEDDQEEDKMEDNEGEMEADE
jgi:hypothetical protein